MRACHALASKFVMGAGHRNSHLNTKHLQSASLEVPTGIVERRSLKMSLNTENACDCNFTPLSNKPHLFMSAHSLTDTLATSCAVSFPHKSAPLLPNNGIVVKESRDNLVEDDFWSQVVRGPAQSVRPLAIWDHFGEAQVCDLDMP